MADLLRAKRLVWGVIFLLVTAVASLSYLSGTRYVAAVRAVEQTLAVQSAIDGTLSLLKDAETGQRGFILTADEQFLEPYNEAQLLIPDALADLKHFATSDAAQAASLARLEQLTAAKQEFMSETIRLRRAGDSEGALARVRSGDGKHLMDQIR